MCKPSSRPLASGWLAGKPLCTHTTFAAAAAGLHVFPISFCALWQGLQLGQKPCHSRHGKQKKSPSPCHQEAGEEAEGDKSPALHHDSHHPESALTGQKWLWEPSRLGAAAGRMTLRS